MILFGLSRYREIIMNSLGDKTDQTFKHKYDTLSLEPGSDVQSQEPFSTKSITITCIGKSQHL